MITKEDVKFFIKYTKEHPKEAIKTIAQATLMTAGAMTIGILAIKGATDIQAQLKNQK